MVIYTQSNTWAAFGAFTILCGMDSIRVSMINGHLGWAVFWVFMSMYLFNGTVAWLTGGLNNFREA